MPLTWLPRWVRRAGRLALSAEARSDARHERQRRRAGEPDLPPGGIRNVLVICHGNICRSPFAAGLLAQRRGELALRSAGLAARDGAPAEDGAVRAARTFGIGLEGHASRRLRAEDVAWADLVLGMEGHHAADVAQRWPDGRPKVRLLGDFLPEPPYAVDDPWGQSDEVFADTFERIAAAVQQLAARLEERGR